MQACLDRARLAARTDLPILILGESGTGKTILARAIHNSSSRKGRPFIAFNAAALSETLLDSQLFGHERGAFTGAQNRVKGKFELADGGTLFIDEVGDLSPTAQSKILRAVETGEFERLGSETLQRGDVRLISATHHPIGVADGRNGFRDDLFYRISGITLAVPSLRERPNDLPTLLANEIARASRRQGTSIVGLDREAADRLLAYPWPGNLRELSKIVQAAVALTTGEVITRRPPVAAGRSTPGRCRRRARGPRHGPLLEGGRAPPYPDSPRGGRRQQAPGGAGTGRVARDARTEAPGNRQGDAAVTAGRRLDARRDRLGNGTSMASF